MILPAKVKIEAKIMVFVQAMNDDLHLAQTLK
jgi:hypothetical protein